MYMSRVSGAGAQPATSESHSYPTMPGSSAPGLSPVPCNQGIDSGSANRVYGWGPETLAALSLDCAYCTPTSEHSGRFVARLRNAMALRLGSVSGSDGDL